MWELNVRFLENFHLKFWSISDGLSQHFITRLGQVDMSNNIHLISNTSCRMTGLCYLVCKFYFGKIEVFWRCVVIIIAQIAFVLIFNYLHLQCIFPLFFKKIDCFEYSSKLPIMKFTRSIKTISAYDQTYSLNLTTNRLNWLFL